MLFIWEKETKEIPKIFFAIQTRSLADFFPGYPFLEF